MKLDLQLPRPLLIPERWPKGETSLSPIFSLAELSLGGAFASRRADAVQTHRERESGVPTISFAAHLDLWKPGAHPLPSFMILLESELRKLNCQIGIITKCPLDSDEREGWRDFLRQFSPHELVFSVDSNLSRPTMSDWSREIFPRAFQQATEIDWLRELKAYELSMSEDKMATTMPSMDAFRFWPGYLKSRSASFASCAASEWAVAGALFSPQNDARGSGLSLILNPTLQAVNDNLEMFWRVNGELKSAALDWQIGALMDELHEAPLLARDRLEHELGNKQFPFKISRPFSEVIQIMIDEGSLLERP